MACQSVSASLDLSGHLYCFIYFYFVLLNSYKKEQPDFSFLPINVSGNGNLLVELIIKT